MSWEFEGSGWQRPDAPALRDMSGVKIVTLMDWVMIAVRDRVTSQYGTPQALCTLMDGQVMDIDADQGAVCVRSMPTEVGVGSEDHMTVWVLAENTVKLN